MNEVKTIDVVEGNKTIAVFMGLKKGTEADYVYDKCDWYDRKEFDYHKSWNELMPVVEKIESDKYSAEITKYSVKIKTVRAFSDQMVAYAEVADMEFETKIEAVYSAVLQFITWYNANK